MKKITTYPKAAIGVVVKDDKILMVKLPNWYANFPSHWVLPGGLTEHGEEPRDAVVREIEEETSIKVKVEKEIEAITRSIFMELYFYKCTYLSGNIIPQAEEVADAQWIPLLNLKAETVGYDNLNQLKRWGYLK